MPKIGLVQMRMESASEKNLEVALGLVESAADSGANIICLPELYRTLYFCRTQEVENFDLAEAIEGDSLQQFSKIAAEKEVVIIVPIFEKRSSGVYHNTALVIDADGSLVGSYRKMHIPQDPGFEEKFYFTPGDLGYQTWETRYGRIGVLICWDQWYPEAARLTALAGADILFYPTAIGWLKEEGADLGRKQHQAWKTVQQGHGVANGCYVAAVNRVGEEGDTVFWGQSFVSDYYGETLAEASSEEAGITFADCDWKSVEDFRRIWPFFRDRRIDSYGDIQKRTL